MCDLQTQNGPFVLNQNFFVKTIHITFIHLFVALSLWRIKKFQKRIQSYKDSSFPGTKWLIRPKSDFFEKNNSYNLHVPLGSFTVLFFSQKSLEQIQIYENVPFSDCGICQCALFWATIRPELHIWPKKGFFQKLYLSNFHLLIAPHHAVKFGKNLSNRSCDISFHNI